MGAYQNDKEIAHTTITSENGTFQFRGLKTGTYDLVFTTDQMYQQIYYYHPTKIADIAVFPGEYSLPDTVTMLVIYPDENASDSSIVVKFKKYVTGEESQRIISQSGCSIAYPIPSIGFYSLRTPPMETELKTVERFLESTSVWWASVHPIMPIDVPPK